MIGGRQFTTRSVNTDKQELVSITDAELANLSISTAKIAGGSITPSKLDTTYIQHPAPQKLAIIEGVDLTAIAATNLYTVSATERVMITGCVVEVDTQTDIDTVCQAGVGVAAGEDDIFTSQILGSLTAVDKIHRFVSVEGILANSNDVIKFGVDIGSTGSGSPSQTATIHLIGFKI